MPIWLADFPPGVIGNAGVRLCATAGRELHPAPKIKHKYTNKLKVVKLFVIRYNGFVLKEKKLLEILTQKKLTLSIAESCTGGLLSNRLTNIPGSSRAFLLGIISYSNSSKNKILKIPEKIIQAQGAVSPQTAKLMAVNARKLAGSSLGIGITGIAGPGGGNKFKPVGTIYIAVASGKKTGVRKFNFSGNRLQIKRRTTDKAIDMLLEVIK